MCLGRCSFGGHNPVAPEVQADAPTMSPARRFACVPERVWGFNSPLAHQRRKAPVSHFREGSLLCCGWPFWWPWVSRQPSGRLRCCRRVCGCTRSRRCRCSSTVTRTHPSRRLKPRPSPTVPAVRHRTCPRQACRTTERLVLDWIPRRRVPRSRRGHHPHPLSCCHRHHSFPVRKSWRSIPLRMEKRMTHQLRRYPGCCS